MRPSSAKKRSLVVRLLSPSPAAVLSHTRAALHHQGRAQLTGQRPSAKAWLIPSSRAAASAPAGRTIARWTAELPAGKPDEKGEDPDQEAGCKVKTRIGGTSTEESGCQCLRALGVVRWWQRHRQAPLRSENSWPMPRGQSLSSGGQRQGGGEGGHGADGIPHSSA